VYRIGELMTAGVLPSGRTLIERAREHIAINDALPEPCTVCGEDSPKVAYFYMAGLVVRLHAALCANDSR